MHEAWENMEDYVQQNRGKLKLETHHSFVVQSDGRTTTKHVVSGNDINGVGTASFKIQLFVYQHLSVAVVVLEAERTKMSYNMSNMSLVFAQWPSTWSSAESTPPV